MLETDKMASSATEKKTFPYAENNMSNQASIRRPAKGDLQMSPVLCTSQREIFAAFTYTSL